MKAEPSAEAFFPTRKPVQASVGRGAERGVARAAAAAMSNFFISASFKRHIEALDGVGQCADGDIVDAALGIAAEGVEGDAAA